MKGSIQGQGSYRSQQTLKAVNVGHCVHHHCITLLVCQCCRHYRHPIDCCRHHLQTTENRLCPVTACLNSLLTKGGLKKTCWEGKINIVGHTLLTRRLQWLSTGYKQLHCMPCLGLACNISNTACVRFSSQGNSDCVCVWDKVPSKPKAKCMV